MSTWHEARDRNIWNEGHNADFHSVDDFWEDRFLVRAGDSNSGPGKRKTSPSSSAENSSSLDEKIIKTASPAVEFTTDSVVGSFIPFGGGKKICPGRTYAKQEAIGALALLLGTFDFKLVTESDELPQPDMKFFSLGILPPKGSFPARMRRRRFSNI